MFDLQRLLEGMKTFPGLQKLMESMLAAVEQITAEGEAGGGLVRARANGRLTLTDLHIDPELLRQPDRELLEELILAACNQALDNVRAKVSTEALDLLPSSFDFPPDAENAPEHTSAESPPSRRPKKK
ncbi:Nucleoid-associated protein YbaB [bacterium HR36]|nr:Nucleoid-associated protein YbaB [bacterium HR36]